jgi:sugar fermentation stimulation protein A
LVLGEADDVLLPFPVALQPAVILDRPNRFILRCRFPDGVQVEAHLPNSGRLTGVLEAGGTAWLAPAGAVHRSTSATVRLVETRSGVTVGVDTSLPNRLIDTALNGPGLDELFPYRFERREFTVGKSRFDFLLRADPRQPMLLEVKSVSWVRDGVGLFPDAVSARGARHLRELASAVREQRYSAAVCFVVQRDDAQRVEPAREVDSEFGEAFDSAMAAGVRFLARRCRMHPGGVTLGPGIPVAS